MSSDKIKKILFVVLLAIMALIWGNNILSLLPKPATEYYRTKNDVDDKKKGEVRASTFNFDTGYKVNSKISDPFMPFYKSEPVAEKPDSLVPKIVPQIVIDHPFKYVGLIKGSKRICGILSDRAGKTYVVAKGDSLESTKILKVTPEIVKLRYQGKEFELELNEQTYKK